MDIRQLTTSNFYVAHLLTMVTILVQTFCGIRIIYCKWKQWKSDRDSVIPIRILPHNHEDDDRPPRIQTPDPGHMLNTSLTNKILPDLKHVICFFLSTLTFIFLHIYKKYLFSNFDLIVITKESRLMLYFINLAPRFLFSIIFPLMFYISHKELRNYWKSQFVVWHNMIK